MKDNNHEESGGFLMKLQDKISQIRKEKGMSQEELAEKLGISRQAVAKWEAGLSYPDVDNLIALSSMFQISIDSLLKEGEDNCSSFQPAIKKSLSDQAIAFLCQAKRECYAGQGYKVASTKPSSYDYHYATGAYSYWDTYFGGEKFCGEEVLYENETPVYSMNYAGRVLEEGFSGDFLKEALLLVPEEYPYRGPYLHRNGDFTYHCIVNGSIDWFQGCEEIFLKDRRVYECHFHGITLK
jgi:transcriptional regulator with XRE-family HTH domain